MNSLFIRAFATLIVFVSSPFASADIAPEPDPCTLDPESIDCGERGGSPGPQVHEEFHKRLRSNEMVTPLGSDVFGDNVSLYNGATEFRVVDIDLAGNGPPMQLARRLKIEARKAGEPLGGFGAWDIDVPYVTGTFTGEHKWDVGSGPPFDLDNNGVPDNQQRCETAWMPKLAANFSLREVWSGFHMHIPTQGDREFYPVHAPLNHPMPTDGSTYKWLARDNFRFRCLPSTANGYKGEGFVAIDAEGTQYTFNIGLERGDGQVRRRYGANAFYQAARTRVYLMASEVKDRFGNWVKYHYQGVGPTAHLTSISASDGRLIDLAYEWSPGYGRIHHASAHGRTWNYGYHASTIVPNRHPVQTVDRVDQITLQSIPMWQYEYTGYLNPGETGSESANNNGCPAPLHQAGSSNFTLAATHAAGATGTFDFTFMEHYRGGVPANSCTLMQDGSYRTEIAHYFQNYSVIKKTVAGVGVPSMTWQYKYHPQAVGIPFGYSSHTPPAVCTNPLICPEAKVVTVTNPDNSKTDYEFGVRFAWNDGRLLKTTVKAPGGSPLRTETQAYVTEADVPGLPFPNEIAPGSSSGSDDWAATRIRPVKSTIINQQAVNFGSTVNTFDKFARPTSVTKASPFGNKTEYTSYYDTFGKWVVGQLNSVRVQENGVDKWPLGRLFDQASLKPKQEYAFGKLVDARTYHPDGQLKTVSDSSSIKLTTLGSYKRGIPRVVTYHDGGSESAVVNDRGEITSVTDAMGYTTSYGYDLMGRISAITYPGGDSTAWTPTNIAFEKIAVPEFGLNDPHWRQTRRTGNGYSITYFDGLWRPVLTRAFDSAKEAVTRRVTQRKFDHAGNETFVSYPLRDNTNYNTLNINGVATTYDALARPLTRVAASEIGPLTTKYEYISLFRTQVTDSKLNVTTTSYQVFDQPSTDAPRLVQYPTGATTTITRDLFGKPKLIQRSGLWNGGTLSADRRFVYDANERLCKSYDPEAGWTVMNYDASNNLAWTTTGSNLSSLTDCQRAGVAAGDKSTRSYDGRNRLLVLDHPTGTDDIVHSYYADGALKTIATPNGGTWTYGYNKRRLMSSENLVVNGLNLTNSMLYNGNGHVSHVTPPGGALTPYSPNALGEPTQVGNYATGVSYHPNGSVAGFTYTNGIVHNQTLNTRQLPDRRYESYNGTVFMDLDHVYDKNGNLTGRLDSDGGVDETRSMIYDGLDRLTWADAPGVLGSAAYTYDPLDNLREIDFAGGARTPQTDVYRYDATNRLYEIFRSNTLNQTQTVPYGHDVRGNMILRGVGGHTHTYDRANRMLSANTGASIENYRYDGHGRRTTIIKSGQLGQSTHFYTREGKLVYERAPSGTVTRHIHLGNRLVATVTGGTISQHTDTLGSIVRRTNLIRGTVGTTVYEPYGSLGVGTTYEQRPGFTGHTTDAATTLSYMQQRYYDSTAMRFLSVDPVAVSTTDGSNFNRYWYANNNPYKYTDPDGRWVCEGSSSNCGKFEAGLAKVKEASGSTRLNDGERSILKNIVNLFGEKGDAGVSISFGSKLNASGVAGGRPDGGVHIELNLRSFKHPSKSTSSNLLSRVIAHEGQHGVDIASRQPESQSRNERKQGEIRGYFAQAIYQKAANFAATSSDGWTPNGGYSFDNIDRQAELSVSVSCGSSCE